MQPFVVWKSEKTSNFEILKNNDLLSAQIQGKKLFEGFIGRKMFHSFLMV